MIKKILLSLFLFVGLGISYTFGYNGYVREIGTYGFSPYDSNNDVEVISKGSFLTNRVGITKDILFLQNGVYFFWGDSPWGFPSLYGYGNRKQGFFQQYGLCDEVILSGEDILQSNPGNCSVTPISSESNEIFTNFLKTVKQNDLFWFVGSENNGGFGLCISSSELHKSLCFGRCKTSNAGAVCSFFPNNYNHELTGSLGLGSGFESISRNFLRPSPAVDGSINGGSNTSDNVSLTGNLIYNKCTNGYVISQIDSLYGNSYRNSCFAGGYDTGLIDQYSSGFVYQVGYGMDFKQLYNLTKNGQSWNNWFNSNLDSMQRYKLGKFGDTNPFMGNPVVLYTYFDILYDRLGILPNDPVTSSYDVLNYCQLLLYSNIDEEYKGSYFKSYCNSLNYNNGGGSINTGEVGNIDDVEILPPGFNGGSDGSVTSSGTVVSVDWSGTLSGSTNENFDGKNFINNFYQKLQSVFQKPIGNAVGIIPSYILVFMFALILFRFLSH